MVNFTFVTQDNPDGRSKRLRNRMACRDCRYKKKRCYHGNTPNAASSGNERRRRQHYIGKDQLDDSHHSQVQSRNHNSSFVKRREPKQHQTNPYRTRSSVVRQTIGTDAIQQNLPEFHSLPPFVGELNPAVRFFDELDAPSQTQDISPARVGVWVSARRPSSRSSSMESGSWHLQQNNLLKAANQTLSSIVWMEDVLALSDIYFSNVHPIIPLLSEHEYRQSLSAGTVPAPLVHAVCLVAAKHETAGPHLRLVDSSDSPVTVRKFCSQLHESVLSMIAVAKSFTKITLVRILALLSLHHEGRDGADQASSHMAQAMYHAQTLALHVKGPKDDNSEMKRTFWCLWTLDRLNSATNSRPCIMADNDIGVTPFQQGESGYAAFDIWYQIATILNRGTGIYRPTAIESETGLELKFPAFEDIVTEMQGWQLPDVTLGTLRIFFLATAILGHRLKSITCLPILTMARLRQQMAASQIIRFMQDDNRLQSLQPLPVIVYAASLALSVAYQQLRYSRLPIEQEEACEDFRSASVALKRLQRKWCAADTVASLAERVSIQIEKAPSLELLRVARVSNSREAPSREHYPRSLEPATQHATTTEGEFQEHEKPGLHVVVENSATFSDELDPFGGMDSMSWMYLNSETPFSLDTFALDDYTEELSCQQTF